MNLLNFIQMIKEFNSMYGLDIKEAVNNIYFIDALGKFIIATICLIISIICFKKGYKYHTILKEKVRKAIEKGDRWRDNYDDHTEFFTAGIYYLTTFATSVYPLIIFLNIWNYIELFKTDIYLTSKILERFIN